MPLWFSQPLQPQQHPRRPWYRAGRYAAPFFDGQADAWFRLDGMVVVVLPDGCEVRDPAGYVIHQVSLEPSDIRGAQRPDVEQALQRLDTRQPLPPPPLMQGQVWYAPDTRTTYFIADTSPGGVFVHGRWSPRASFLQFRQQRRLLLLSGPSAWVPNTQWAPPPSSPPMEVPTPSA